ncbi:DNA polymerase III subunit beta [Brucella sp. IR073]|uniref:DNA polymerase III subunit beta n=1 Tax=unclassified Brucella TaxID=2632610 RepID=UPI003B97D989
MTKIPFKIETTAHSLVSVLKLADKIIERRNTIPVLSMVLFDGARVRATDLDMEIDIALPVTFSQGSAALDHGALFNLVRHLPRDEAVKLSAEDGRAVISFSSGHYRIPALPAEDFPKLDIGQTTVLPIDGDELKRALYFTSPFISKEETRYYLNGVCLDGGNVVATDGHRLGLFPTQKDYAATKRMIVPRKVVSIINGLPAPIGFEFSAKPGLRLQYDGLTITAKAIDGTFPDWTRVVPSFKDEHPCATFDRVTAQRAIGRILSVMQDQTRHGILAFRNGRISLKQQSGELAASEIIQADTAEEMAVGLNLKYLSQIIRSFPAGGALTLHVSDAQSPTKITQDARGEFVVLMPTRADDALMKSAFSDLRDGGPAA